MKSLGIDLSLSATGAVVLTGENYLAPGVAYAGELKTKPDTKANRFARVEKVADGVLEAINFWKPERVVLENYGVSKFQTGQIEIIELGGIVRAVLWKLGVEYLDPTPSQLKKFVTGSGGAKKEQVMMRVQMNWGYAAKTNNLADAFGLACIGLAWSGKLPAMTQPMHEVIGMLKLN